MDAIPTTNAKFIEQKYIERVLNQEASNIFEAQNRVLARFNPKSIDRIKNNRRFTVTGTTLEITHTKLQRFIDMKNVRGQKRKSIPNHNRVIYGHFNNIINRLAFGLTNDVKQLLVQEHNIQL